MGRVVPKPPARRGGLGSCPARSPRASGWRWPTWPPKVLPGASSGRCTAPAARRALTCRCSAGPRRRGWINASWTLKVVAAPQWRGRGLGTQMSGLAGASRRGFEPIRETYGASVGVRQLVKESYERSHRDNPAAKLVLGEWTASCPGGLGAGRLPLRVQSGERASVALARHSVRPGRLELDWRGIAASHAAHRREMLRWLGATQLRYTASRGLRPADLEVHCTDAARWAGLGGFPFAPAPCRVTPRRPLPPALASQ